MRLLAAMPLSLVLSATLVQHVTAQRIRPPSFDTLRVLRLDSVGDVATAYFRPQHRARALDVHSLLRDYLAFYREHAGIETRMRVAVVDSSDWGRLTNAPYGLPANSGPGAARLLIIAASPPDRVGTRELPRGVLLDFLTIGHEGGHLLAWQLLPADMRAAMASAARPAPEMIARFQALGRIPAWYFEMVANYFTTAFLESKQPEGGAAWNSYLRRISAGDRPRFTHLDDWFGRVIQAAGPDSTPYPFTAEGGRNMDWYQSVAGQVASHIYRHSGLTFISHIRSVLASSAPTTPQLVTQLDSIAPGASRLLRDLGAGWEDRSP